MRKIVTITFALSMLAIACRSQNLSKRDIEKASLRVADLIRANYVLEEKGYEIADGFIKDYEEGRFDFAQSWAQLDSVMSLTLKEVSSDGHLYTWHNLKIVEQLKHESRDKAEEGGEEFSSFFNNKEAIESNFGFQSLEIHNGNIGYLKLSKINISDASLKTLYAAMEFVKNTRGLIIDLRDNSGGGSTVGSVLETFFFEKEIDLLEFKSRAGKTEMARTVPWLLEKRYTQPLYILINGGTASAAEALAFALKHQGRATIVGEPSAGGAFMNKYFLVNDQLVLAVSDSAPFLPGTQISWQGTGVKPDVAVEEAEAKEKALGLMLGSFDQ